MNYLQPSACNVTLAPCVLNYIPALLPWKKKKKNIASEKKKKRGEFLFDIKNKKQNTMYLLTVFYYRSLDLLRENG